MRTRLIVIAFVLLTLPLAMVPADEPTTARADVHAAARAIADEAARPNDSPAGRPLPLAGHWNVGAYRNCIGFNPAWQMSMIEQGRHLLPWFDMPEPGVERMKDDYYEKAIRRAAEWKLPLSFVSTQWEHLLTDDPALFNLPAESNPNVVDPSGKTLKMVCPFGPVEAWRRVGARWTDTATLKKIQQWYPDTPLVLFLSNNEHARLTWKDVEKSRRYLDLYGKGRDDAFKRKVVAEGWIERYRALQDGMRQGLPDGAWRKNAIFVGYEAFGPPHLGRWGGWMEYSLTTPGRIDPWPLAWDGGSPSFYDHNWCEIADYTVWSPQIESMNWPFMLEEALRLNPTFWFELSVWDGHEPSAANDKRKTYAARGQAYSPARWGGQVQFGLWLLRPRLVREFRGWTDALDKDEPYFRPVMAAVDRVYDNATLREFWRTGTLVANRAGRHPYQELIPPEYKDKDRWFLLDADLAPAPPLKLNTEIKLFAMALVVGAKPERRWLLYAHSPLADRKDVTVTLPDFGPVKVDVPVAGSFCVVREKGRETTVVSGK